MRNKRIIPLVACILVLVFLAGCTLNILYAIPLLTPGSENAGDLVIAVQPNGLKHLLWGQASPSGTTMTYWRSWFGSPILTVNLPGWAAGYYDSRWSDIAVTSDGTAYPVWANIHKSSISGYICYESISPTGAYTLPPNCSNFGPRGTPPKVVARGTIAYIVWDDRESDDGDHNFLFYTALAGTTGSGKVYLSTDLLYQNHAVKLAIDSLGHLHVAWIENRGGSSLVWHNTNASVQPNGDMNVARTIYIGPEDYDHFPDIAILGSGSEEKVYIAYIHYDETYSTDRLYVTSCPVAGCASGLVETEIELEASKRPWTLAEVNALAIGDNLYIAFLADNNDTVNQEVYLYNSPGGSAGTLNKLTAADYEKAYEKINLFLVSGGNSPVLSWQRYTPTCPINDAYVWDILNTTRLALDAECLSLPGDMASAGDWVAGALVNDLSMTDSRQVPWLLTNGYRIDLPVIIR